MFSDISTSIVAGTKDNPRSVEFRKLIRLSNYDWFGLLMQQQ